MCAKLLNSRAPALPLVASCRGWFPRVSSLTTCNPVAFAPQKVVPSDAKLQTWSEVICCTYQSRGTAGDSLLESDFRQQLYLAQSSAWGLMFFVDPGCIWSWQNHGKLAVSAKKQEEGKDQLQQEQPASCENANLPQMTELWGTPTLGHLWERIWVEVLLLGPSVRCWQGIVVFTCFYFPESDTKREAATARSHQEGPKQHLAEVVLSQ